MARPLTRPRRTPLPGFLALAAGLAALALVLGAVASPGADPLSGTSARDGPMVCRGEASQTPEALRQDHPTCAVKVRATSPGPALSAAGASPKRQAPAWLCPARARRQG